MCKFCQKESSLQRSTIRFLNQNETKAVDFFCRCNLPVLTYFTAFASYNSRDLTNDPFIRKCLSVAGASSVKLKKSLPPKIIDVFLEGRIEEVLGNKENQINVMVIFIGNKAACVPVSMCST